MTQRVRRLPVLPCRQPAARRLSQPTPQAVITGPAAEAGMWIGAFAGQQRRVRMLPVVAELVPHLAQPPIQQLADLVDRWHQPSLRAAPAAAFAVPHMQFAVRAQVASLIADVEHVGLPDPQPAPPPQRRSTDPSELATSDSVDTDIDLDRVRPLAPLTEPDPGDTATATADLADDDIDDDSGQEVFLDGRAT